MIHNGYKRFCVDNFLRLTKENTTSTRYTSEVRIHIEANPPYAAA